jgi:hypothetical protein
MISLMLISPSPFASPAEHEETAAVPSATVVIMNPPHFAVALKYDAAKMRAPRVLAKGVDLVAQNIRRLISMGSYREASQACEGLSRYLECGAGMTGPNADLFRVQLAIVTMIQAISATRTQIRTALAAGARTLEGNSSDAVQCGTSGELEARIAALVSSRLTTP